MWVLSYDSVTQWNYYVAFLINKGVNFNFVFTLSAFQYFQVHVSSNFEEYAGHPWHLLEHHL